MRGAIPGAENLRFATVLVRSTHRILPCFILYNQNVHIATAACIQESALFATVACAKMYEICISLQSRAIHVPHPARCMVYPDNQNMRLPTAACNQKSGMSTVSTHSCPKDNCYTKQPPQFSFVLKVVSCICLWPACLTYIFSAGFRSESYITLLLAS